MICLQYGECDIYFTFILQGCRKTLGCIAFKDGNYLQLLFKTYFKQTSDKAPI